MTECMRMYWPSINTFDILPGAELTFRQGRAVLHDALVLCALLRTQKFVMISMSKV